MLAFVSSVSSLISVILSEIDRLGNYLDAYPVLYYILGLYLVCNSVGFLKLLLRST